MCPTHRAVPHWAQDGFPLFLVQSLNVYYPEHPSVQREGPLKGIWCEFFSPLPLILLFIKPESRCSNTNT